MASDSAWCVLNPGGRDSKIDFSAGPGLPGGSEHPPVNYHAYAACSAGAFYQDLNELPVGPQRVIVLLRQRNLPLALRCIKQVQNQGGIAWVSLKESGAFQAGELMADPGRWRDLSAVCQQADGCLSSTPDLVELYRSAGAKCAEFVPTPYPVDLPEWNFSTPVSERSGIFLGTREFNVSSRRHFVAVAVALRIGREFGCPVFVINTERRHGAKLLSCLVETAGSGAGLHVIDGPVSYQDYLARMSACRVVWQLDRSRVPGQVAGDALLCRMPCIGGDGAVDRLGHPLTHGDGRSDPELAAILVRALVDAEFYRELVNSSIDAGEKLDFRHGAAALQRLI